MRVHGVEFYSIYAHVRYVTWAVRLLSQLECCARLRVQVNLSAALDIVDGIC